MSTAGSIAYTHPTPGVLTRWSVSVGANVEEGAVVAEFEGKFDHSYITITTPHEGKVEELVAKQGKEYSRGDVLLRVVACTHGLCASCGRDLTVASAHASSKHSDITIVHGQPRLTVTRKQAEHIEKETAERLLKQKKLSLVLDLDHTLIHAATEPHFVQFVNFHKIDIKAEKLHEFVLPGSTMKYFVKLRPHLANFLEEAAKIFELHMYTFGTRSYALKIADIIDPKHHNFKDRILSRDDAGDIDYKTLNKIFPCDDSMVLIVDDRADVWKKVQNLVQIEPFLYFVGAPEINPHPWDPRQTQPNGQPLPPPPNQPPQPTVHHLKPSSRRNSNQQLHKPSRPTEKENGEKATEKGAKQDIVQKESEEITEKAKSEAGTTDEQVLTNKTSEPNGKELENSEEKKNAENGHAHADKIEGSEKVDKDIGDKEKENGENVARAQEDTTSNGKQHSQDKNEEATAEGAKEQKKPDVPPRLPPRDVCLPLMLDILREIHARFYALHAQGEPSDAKVIATEMRLSVFRGCSIVFSGFYPREVDPRITPLGKLAISFGAEVQQDLTDSTTHLVAKKNHTDKVKVAHAKHIPVVTDSWLVASSRSWKRANETDHLLPSDDNQPISDVKAENGGSVEQKKGTEGNSTKNTKHTGKHTNGNHNGKSVAGEANGHPKPPKIAKQEPTPTKEQGAFVDIPYPKEAKWNISHKIFAEMTQEVEEEIGGGEEGDEEENGEFDYEEDRERDDEDKEDAIMEGMEDDREERAYKPSKGMANLLKQRRKRKVVEVEAEDEDSLFASLLEDQIGNQ